jgi:hypothetical protein
MDDGPGPYHYGDDFEEFLFWVGEFVEFLQEWAAEQQLDRPPGPWTWEEVRRAMEG